VSAYETCRRVGHSPFVPEGIEPLSLVVVRFVESAPRPQDRETYLDVETAVTGVFARPRAEARPARNAPAIAKVTSERDFRDIDSLRSRDRTNRDRTDPSPHRGFRGGKSGPGRRKT
jgi:hypothetical protein